jgi:hypothetical protein
MKTFLTEYPGPDGLYTGEVEALDWEHAQLIEDGFDRSGVVIGELVLKISRDGMTHEDADRLCRDLAASYEI